MTYIDLRSDTITQPTEEMRQAMYNAVVGDDVYHEDETVNRLESLAAKMVNKEAALFVASGTMGNQLAIMTHTKRGDEVIAADSSHVIQAEVGAASVISGVTIRTAKNHNGVIEIDDVKCLIRGKNVHFPDTGLICLENATSVGTVVPVSTMKEVYCLAKESEVPVHLDGARLFNAAVAMGVEAGEIASYADSVMFCLSKGLCSPIGSILTGSHEFIKKARRNRKMLGGGLRQAGFLAAAGIVSLEKMVYRLKDDHQNAKILAAGLNQIPGIKVDESLVQIDMVFADISGTGKSQEYILKKLLEKGIKANDGREGNYIRFVTNHGVSDSDIEYVIETIYEIVKKS